jgi:hypothetical protein
MVKPLITFEEKCKDESCHGGIIGLGGFLKCKVCNATGKQTIEVYDERVFKGKITFKDYEIKTMKDLANETSFGKIALLGMTNNLKPTDKVVLRRK